MRRFVLLFCLSLVAGCGGGYAGNGGGGGFAGHVGDKLGPNGEVVIYKTEKNYNKQMYWMATTFDVGEDSEQQYRQREDFRYNWHGYPWSLNNIDIATQEAVGSGTVNTWVIIKNQGERNGLYAAWLCNVLEVTTDQGQFNDWFLPSMGELRDLYRFTKSQYPNPDDRKGRYWSSTQSADPKEARYINFSDGMESELLKDDRATIRCVRKQY